MRFWGAAFLSMSTKTTLFIYDLRYVRFSSNTIFGTVTENSQRKQEFYKKIGVSRQERKEKALELLHYGMENYPHFERVVTDLMFGFAVLYMKAKDDLLEFEKQRIVSAFEKFKLFFSIFLFVRVLIYRPGL